MRLNLESSPLPRSAPLLQIRKFRVQFDLSPAKWKNSGYKGELDLRTQSHQVVNGHQQLLNPFTDVQGFIARDDDQKEIVVALRGRLDNLNYVNTEGN